MLRPMPFDFVLVLNMKIGLNLNLQPNLPNPQNLYSKYPNPDLTQIHVSFIGSKSVIQVHQ